MNFFLLQKKAVRIVHGDDYYAPSNPIFIALKTLKIYDIVDLSTLSVTYKARDNKLPTYVKNMFKHRESIIYNLNPIILGVFVFLNKIRED